MIIFLPKKEKKRHRPIKKIQTSKDWRREENEIGDPKKTLRIQVR